MSLIRTFAVLVAAAFAVPALAAPVAVLVPAGGHSVLVQGKGEEHGQKKAKGKQGDKKNADRSNKGGETRGAERSDQVQGMQDSGKGGAKRKQ
jgi:hypothetical protein